MHTSHTHKQVALSTFLTPDIHTYIHTYILHTHKQVALATFLTPDDDTTHDNKDAINACLSRALAHQLGDDWRPHHVRERIGELPESGAGLWDEDIWRRAENGLRCGIQVA